MKRIFLLMTVCGLLWGCEETATSDLGVFVPNVEGAYSLSNVTADCVNEFDSIDVIQDESHLVLQPQNASFTSFNGTIDEDGVIAATGASSFGSLFECTGQAASNTLSLLCSTDLIVCTDPADPDTCVTTTLTCAASYESE